MKSITKTVGAVWSVVEMLPFSVKEEIYRFADRCRKFDSSVSEIRLRTSGYASLTVAGENIPLSVSLSKEEMEETVKRFCCGSVYAHSDTINEGYISVSGGVRVGLVGRAVCAGERVSAVHEISSLNIRIPHLVLGVGAPVLSELEKDPGAGVLIYSTPGVGKTTLLRSLAYELSKEKRVAVIDSRRELEMGEARGRFLDILSGYPKAYGIELATRTLSPEYIICDEIGADESEAILHAHTGGVPLIASVHAASIDDICNAPSVSPLLRAGIFGYCVGITREQGVCDYVYDIKRSDNK